MKYFNDIQHLSITQPLKCFSFFFLEVNYCGLKKDRDKDLGKYKTGLVNKIT